MTKSIKMEFVELLFVAFTQEQLNALPPAYLEEMEKLFMSGYQKAWERITTIVKMPEAEGEVIVKKTGDELNAFFKALATKPPVA